MAGQIFLVGAALGAAFLATRQKQIAADPPVNDTDREQISSGGALAAAAASGKYIGTDGAAAESSCGGLDQAVVVNGTTSNTPSGDTVGGDTSTTPSFGGRSLEAVGVVEDAAGTSSPSGPVPTKSVSIIEPAIVKYGDTGGLTTKQLSRALSSDGPLQGLVW